MSKMAEILQVASSQESSKKKYQKRNAGFGHFLKFPYKLTGYGGIKRKFNHFAMKVYGGYVTKIRFLSKILKAFHSPILKIRYLQNVW